MMLPVQSQSVARSESAVQPRDLNQILQPNVEQSARVVNVRQDPVSPTLFRISLEIGNHRLDVMTNRPLAEGLTVLLSRDARGEVALRLPMPAATPAQVSQTQAQALSQLSTNSNQFIAMIAPESRARAQQLLTQTQMTALVQPQLSASNAAPVVGNRQIASNTPSQQSTGAKQVTNTAPQASQTSGSPAAQPESAPAPTTTNPPATAGIQVGTAAAVSSAVNQAPINAATAIGGQGAPNQGSTNVGSASAGVANQTATPANTPAQANAGPAASATPNTAPTASASLSVNTNPQTVPAPTPQTQTGTAQTAQTSVAGGPSINAPTTPNPSPNTSPSPSLNNAAVGAQQPASAAPAANQQNTVQVQTPNSSSSASTTNGGILTTQTGVTLARVVQSIEPTPNQPNFARASINLGGETINIITPRPLLAGQQIEVTRLNDQAVQVRLLPPQPVKTMPAEVVEEMQQLMRQAMPLQAPLADSLNQMRALNSGQKQDAVGQIVRSLMGLFSLTPQTKPEASAKQVEQMMQQSGLFTENRMARQASGQPLSVDDLRTRLGQLRRASQELPPQVRDQMNMLIDKAEARATHHQITSARQWRDYPDGSAERYFRMDLPLQTPEGFKQVELELREQRRPTSTTETQTNWTLNLHFDLDPIGPVDARVHLEDEWDVSVAFWAESTRTTEMIRDRLESFSNHLQQQGFQVDTINVRKGRAPNDLAPAISRHLVDVHT